MSHRGSGHLPVSWADREKRWRINWHRSRTFRTAALQSPPERLCDDLFVEGSGKAKLRRLSKQSFMNASREAKVWRSPVSIPSEIDGRIFDKEDDTEIMSPWLEWTKEEGPLLSTPSSLSVNSFNEFILREAKSLLLIEACTEPSPRILISCSMNLGGKPSGCARNRSQIKFINCKKQINTEADSYWSCK